MVAASLIHYFKKNRIESLALLFILVLAACLRFYNITGYMTFLGDEGRDAIIVKDLLINHHLPFLGPPTSIGNMYDGPMYYYMMAAAMAIFWLNPAGAAGMVALIGVATVGLIYYLSRRWFGKEAAITASLLYSLSPVTIVYSHSSWNPNPAPFFSLLTFVFLYKTYLSRDFRWFILVGLTISAAVQMHFLGLILIAVVGMLWLYLLYLMIVKKEKYCYVTVGTIGAVLGFLLLFTPWFLFEFKHSFPDIKAMFAFFTNRQTTVNLNPLNTLSRIGPIYSYNLITRYMSMSYSVVGIITSMLVIFFILVGFYDHSKRRIVVNWPNLNLLIWLFIGVLGLALYKQTIFDHYLGFLNPAPYLAIGSGYMLIKRFTHKPWYLVCSVTLSIWVLLLVVINLQSLPLQYPPHNELQHTQEIAKFVITESDNEPFNFALLSQHNYDRAYQYYLELYNHPPQMLPFQITNQLFVVCEDPICQPINNPKYEIAAFGWSKIVYEKDFDGVKVYKLTHNYPQSSPSATRSL